MKKCKYCQSEIDDKAKICPQCKKKQPNLVKTIITVAIVAVVIIAIIGAIGSGGNQEKGSLDKQGDKSKVEDVVAGIGEYIEQDGVKVSFIDVREVSGNMFLSPGDGKVYIIAEFEIENNTSNELAISSLLQFTAYVDDYVTDLSISAESAGGADTLDGSIAAGKKLRGAIGYEVSQDWKKLEIQFKPNVISSKVMKFETENPKNN
ncbi:MAG: DUF4352 domain-containing protein [Clostridiales bacterium]|nr:DUF4352 domain-containing protein [Clostridiales bacterium]